MRPLGRSISLLACVLALLEGCGGEAGPADALETPPVERRSYVVARIRAETGDATLAFGFDLDGADGNPPGAPAGGCQDAPDFVSARSGAAGVDDQLAVLAPALDGVLGGDGLDGTFRDAIESGRLLLVIEVAGITSYVNDDTVQVHAMLGALGSGDAGSGAPLPSTACAAHVDASSCLDDLSSACSWSATAGVCTGLEPGQTFSPIQDLGTTDGSISNGMLSTTIASLPLTLLAQGNTVTLALHDVRLRGRITVDAIVLGEIGGAIAVPGDCPPFGDFCTGPPDFAAPDLEPSADGLSCASFSAGLAFDAVSAILAR